jgi:serine protease inhibitor
MKSINESTYDLASANRLFVSPKQEVRKCMQELFTDEITYTDFAASPSLAVKNINKWVEDVTKNQIKDLLKDDDLTVNTQLVLVST